MRKVGADAARFFFIMRSLDSQLDFDLDLAKSQSNENPVYYVQYAHARICSIFRQMKEAGIEIKENPDLSLLTDEAEIALIKKLLSYPDEIALAAKKQSTAPHCRLCARFWRRRSTASTINAAFSALMTSWRRHVWHCAWRQNMCWRMVSAFWA